MNSAGRHTTLFFTFFFLLAGLIQSWAEETPMLERTISIIIKNERMDVALKKISQQGGFTFSYNPSIIDVNKVVSFNFTNKSIREVLDELFDGNIDYKERKKYVILAKAKRSASSKEVREVSGYITDQETGYKLADVTIYDPTSLSSAVTDAYGFFKIKINNPTPDLILTVNKQNYSDTLVVVPDKNGLLKIQLANSKKKIVSITDSVLVKLKRFWNNKIMISENVNVINVNDTLYRKRQLSLFPFIGTNHKMSGNVINNYSVNIFGGYSLGVRNVEVGGIFNTVRGDVNGVQVAGIFNGVLGKTKGLQMAGIMNANYDSTRGAQLAGMINLNWNAIQPFSAAGLLNITHHDSRGVGLAGLGNITLGRQDGVHGAGLLNFSLRETGPVQVAGLLNISGGTMNGIQLAGIMNVTLKNVTGLQAGGIINFTGGHIKGVQLSGLLNYATSIKGFQLGLVNVSDSIKGIPIGLLSFVWKGYHALEVSADEVFYTNVAFRTGVRQFYNIFTAGMKPENKTENFWYAGYGVGTSPRLAKGLWLNIDVTANQVSKGDFTKAVNLLNKAYIGFEIQPWKKIGFILGATLNSYLTDTTYDKYSPLFTDYNPKIIYDHTYSNNINMKMWWGAKLGLRIL